MVCQRLFHQCTMFYHPEINEIDVEKCISYTDEQSNGKPFVLFNKARFISEPTPPLCALNISERPTFFTRIRIPILIRACIIERIGHEWQLNKMMCE
jgi:hypothetical protein